MACGQFTDREELEMRPYTVVDSERHCLGRFEVCMDTLLIEQQEYPYSYTRMKESVAILPVNEEEQVVGLIYQYRHAIDQWVYEVVAGGIEKGETPKEAAIRELEEEAGFIVKPENIIPLGTVYPVAGTSNEKMHFFVSKGFFSGKSKREPTEFVKPIVWRMTELENRIADGSFTNMYGIALWYKYFLYREQQRRDEI